MTAKTPCGQTVGHGESCVEGYLCEQCTEIRRLHAAPMNIRRTPEYEAKVYAHAAAHGPFMASMTLLGGSPDRNRRTIYNILTEGRLDTFNQDMGVWTPELEFALGARIKELNDAYLAQQESPLQLPHASA